MKIISLFKWLVPMILLVGIGTKLINYSSDQEASVMRGYELYDAARLALQAGDFKGAYALFLQSAYESHDPQLQGTALYEAANVGWFGEIADYRTLVSLYQQSLRYNPELYEAAFDLEYLYWLKANAPEKLPQPKPGEPQPGQNPSQPGQIPGGQEGPNGDI